MTMKQIGTKKQNEYVNKLELLTQNSKDSEQKHNVSNANLYKPEKYKQSTYKGND